MSELLDDGGAVALQAAARGSMMVVVLIAQF
jgi:hypothetical protein